MKKTIVILAVLAALVSCNKEMQETIQLPAPDAPAAVPELRATILDTKMAISDNGDKTYSFAFEEGDEIAVFNGVKEEEAHLPVRYRCTGIEDGVAVFSYSPVSSDDSSITPDPELATVVATYPYRSPTTGGFEVYGENTLKIRMPATGSTSKTEEPVYIKTSTPMVASADKDATLRFVHSAGLLELTIKGSAAIKKIAMTSDKNISGDASVNYVDSAPELTVTGTGKTITYTYESGVTLNPDNGVKFYFGLPAGSHDLTFVITDSEEQTMTITTPGVTVSRAQVTKGGFTFSPDPLANVTNLSAFGRFANCYVVSAAGSYCFNARKPDGTTVSGASAVWVWAAGEAFSTQKTEAQLNAKMVSDISMENGKIYFSVPTSFTVGNVVLGVINEDKDLLYTWHIWLTSNDLADNTAQGITLMDRNLGAGAVYDVALATNLPLQNGKGCFYQWGRKDPILGGRNSPSGAENPAYGTTNSQYTIVNSEAGINNVSEWGLAAFTTFTVEAGAARPVTMGNGPTAKPGYEAGNTAAWSKRTNANPCPYGYRPISSTEFTTLKEAGNPVISNYNNFAQVNLGGVIFARAGYRGGTDAKAKEGQGSSSTARYWTDTASSASQGILMKITWSDNTTLGTTWWSLAGFNANHACNVRCVKE